MDNPAVQLATTEAERASIYRLRYDVYIDEMDGKQRHAEADAGNRLFSDEWDDRAYHFYGYQDGAMAACARVILRRDGPLECEDQLELTRFAPEFPKRVSMSSRLALHPKIRGNHLLKQLTCAMYTFGREQDLRYDFIDCHPRLLPLYSRLGYRIYRPGFNHPKYTYVVPMVLVLDDADYLERVKSPFASIADGFARSSDGTDLLLSRFPEYAGDTLSAVGHAEDFWDLLHTRLLDVSLRSSRCDILEGLTAEEIKLLTAVGHILPCQEGDTVLTVDDPGREVFLILEGSFEVHGTIHGTQGQARVLKPLMAGDSFGEIRFLTEKIRYASVSAIEDSCLLVLNARALDRLIVSHPKIAAKVFRNLARLVATRLCDIALPS